MKKYLDIPNFASEAEEAAWWPQQEDDLLQAFQQAEKVGDLGCGTVANVARLVPLATGDADLAAIQAARKGTPVEAHVQSLLHHALAAEERSTIG